MDSVNLTIPYLKARSVGGTLMTLGHIVFAAHFFMMGLKFGPRRLGAALLTKPAALVKGLPVRAGAGVSA
jgi:cytochrome c oxidase cbb3-type subunit 1